MSISLRMRWVREEKEGNMEDMSGRDGEREEICGLMIDRNLFVKCFWILNLGFGYKDMREWGMGDRMDEG